jgi:hypothetical protein
MIDNKKAAALMLRPFCIGAAARRDGLVREPADS